MGPKNIETKLHFIQGKHDGISSPALTEKYYQWLVAKQKTWHSFDHSAHLCHIEEPAKFRNLLLKITAVKDPE